MKLSNKIATGFGVITLSALSLFGCQERNQFLEVRHVKSEPKKVVDYFADLHMASALSDMPMVSRDFDGDGDFDLIVGLEGRLYHFENDGKGNLTIKPPKNY